MKHKEQAIQERPYQARGVKFCKEHKQCYLAVDMGLGKTKIVIDTFKDLDCGILVFAPIKGIYSTWPDEIVKWDPTAEYEILHGPGKDAKLHNKAKYYFINPEGIKWLYNALAKMYQSGKTLPFTELVIDEGAMWKASNTSRFTLLKRFLPIFENYRLILSGKPMPNGHMDLWSQYYIIDEGVSLHPAITIFRNRYFNHNLEAHKYFLKPGADEAILKAIKSRTFRLDAKDYIEIPDLVPAEIRLELSPKLRAQYNKLEREFLLKLDNDKITVKAKSAATLSLKLRQFIQGALYHYTDDIKQYKVMHKLKLEALQEQVEALGGDPLLVAIQFRFELDLLKKTFGDIPCIAGGTKAQVSSKYIRDWNNKEIPIMCVHPQSMSHSINLQYGGNYITWLGLTWSLDHFDQLNGRLHRSGQVEPVICTSILIKDTIDDVLYRVLKRKDKSQMALLNALNDYKESRL